MVEKAYSQEMFSRMESLEKELSETADGGRLLGHYQRELAALNSFSRAVTAGHCIGDVAQAALREIEEIAAPDLAFVFEQKNRELLPLAKRVSSGQIADVPLARHWPGTCLCGLACSGEAVFSTNIHQDSRCILNDCKLAGIRSFAALPLQIEVSAVQPVGESV